MNVAPSCSDLLFNQTATFDKILLLLPGAQAHHSATDVRTYDRTALRVACTHSFQHFTQPHAYCRPALAQLECSQPGLTFAVRRTCP